jgi:hypothetical protein
MIQALLLCLLALTSSGRLRADEPDLRFIDSEVCVIGATSGGIVAAIQAKSLGLEVCLIGLTPHVGGLTTGGLGATDVGNTATIGGRAREFYQRVGSHYSLPIRYQFEPRVATRVFSEWLAEAGIVPLINRKPVAAEMEGVRLRRVRFDDGTVIRARIFIDATYEGDLLPLAGVGHTWGRESTAQYGESLNGIRASTPSHQFAAPVDPYPVPGDPSSGLLPLVNGVDMGTPGEADHRIQAYNYRLCFTNVATNRLPHVQPPDYDPARYELLARHVEARVAAGQSTAMSAFFNVSGMPNGKTDINNNGAVSTDYIGMNYEYPTASYARRAELDREHLHYIQGLVWFLATSPRVPSALRTQIQGYGPCRDEWVEHGGYSPQIYVREALRMVSDYVVTQRDCQYQVAAPDPVCLGSYNMDSHNCQRHVLNGAARNEGDVQVAPSGPYGISYRSLVPKVGECDNLFETFAISASHIAFGSTRMEPVFMMAAHAAADAAALAIRRDLSVQAVPYPELARQLRAEGQVITWGAAPASGVVVDNREAAFTGEWLTSTSVGGFHGPDYAHDNNQGQGTKTAVFRPNLPAAGEYQVLLRWTSHANRASQVPVDVLDADGLTTHHVNMQGNNGIWVLLRRVRCEAGTNAFLRIRTHGANGFVVADAALWAPVTTEVEVLAADPRAGERGPDAGRFLLLRSAPSLEDELPIAVRWSGSASNGVDVVPLPSVFNFPPGQAVVDVGVLPLADHEVEGREELRMTLLPGPEYHLGAYTQAVVTVQDQPYDAWRREAFPPSAWGEAEVSGPDAVPQPGGVPNRIAYALALAPGTPTASATGPAHWGGERLRVTLTRNRQAVDHTPFAQGRSSLVGSLWDPAQVRTTAVEEVSAEIDRLTLELVPIPEQAPSGALRVDLVP